MDKDWDGQLKEMIQSQVEQAELPEEANQRLLAEIHKQINGRSNHRMKYTKKRMIVAIAAAVMAVGTITAIGAGKITGLTSSINRNMAIHSAQELEKQGGRHMGGQIRIPDALSDGSKFSEGFITNVKATDDQGNTAGTYPTVFAKYGTNGNIYLNIDKSVIFQPAAPKPAQKEETYQGILIKANADQYLFLPPNAKPAPEDLKLQQEGKLFISYGSDTPEREVFASASWAKDGITYLISTYDHKSLDEMIAMAKAYIDGK